MWSGMLWKGTELVRWLFARPRHILRDCALGFLLPSPGKRGTKSFQLSSAGPSSFGNSESRLQSQA